MPVGKVTLVGVGLLGGSLGRALRERRLAREVVGVVRRAETIEECAAVGATDHTTLDLESGIRGADWIVLGTPLGQMGSLARRLVPFLKAGARVTDVGSAKAELVADLEPLIAASGATYVGSHPMAGGDRTGVLAARADLFQNSICAVTPTDQTPSDAVAAVSEFWESVGAEVMLLSPQAHDHAVAWSSHLPHVVAALLADRVLDPHHPDSVRRLCATGFRSTTRIASGSPEMWRDIALANRTALDRALADQAEQLADFRRLLAAQDGPGLLASFARAKARRDAWCPTGPSADRGEECRLPRSA